MVSPPGRAKEIPELMDPAALMGDPGIDRLSCRRQARPAIGHDELELAPFEATAMKIVQQALPGGLALAGPAREGEQLPGAIGPHPIGREQLHALAAAGPPHSQTHPIEKQIPPVIGQGA